MKKIAQFFFSKPVLAVCLLATVFLTIRQSSELRHATKKIETISFDPQILLKKIQQTPPVWMREQIQQDLSFYVAGGIRREMLDAAFQGKRIYELGLVRFTVNNGHLSFSLDNRYLDGHRFRQVLAAIQKLHAVAPLPDIDFIISLEDHIDGIPNLPIFPCLVFAKRSDSLATVLIPDFKALAGYDNLRVEIEKGSDKFAWDNKKEKVFWRGSTTGGHFTANNWSEIARGQLVMLSLQHAKELDARFHHVAQCDPEVPNLMKKAGMVSSSVKKVDHLQYKYLVDVDGNSCTYERCFWILLSNSLLLKQNSPNIQWYYKALKPYQHYIPVREDLSDLLEKITWARTHDAEAKAIAEAGTEFVRNNLSSEDVMLYMHLLLNEYSRLQQHQKI